MNLRVKIKRVKDVELPKYAKPGDSGFDLVAAEDTIIWPGETKVVPTGLAFEIPPGYELQVRPRSGISRKTFLRVVLGTVDSGFRGEVGVIVSNTSYIGNHITLGINDDSGIYANVKYEIKKGDRIAQGVIAPVETANFVEVDELSDSERGNQGFGSTGVK
ncbi:deoxyuridine 5'-triphosphate nucleotidohydrolase [Bacillus cereus group sp. Bc222]|uniref:dUTP diphosphatase n=1 Tax=Bacillus TaxID=1386 RepID=UPI000F506860|nr:MULTISPECIES: deoxyuridine 5'-triphosphate nucleotidohydrolase [Bacillus]AYY25295.1 deoxyuridine 5'-triphosphate nucleotidohydrolase [Bacillus sp. FDAARGOS_527]MDA2013050.1 deoxyuridine 5'-triphosphate nucleotidohydrolase [Bacillus cereus group sp. Bcc09]MDA2242063.1 deoxyuridine 5'-triphosphate nucleotidohydrolase [Bacillus cereus group sp. Bc222]